MTRFSQSTVSRTGLPSASGSSSEEHHGHPVLPHEVAHGGAGADVGEESVALPRSACARLLASSSDPARRRRTTLAREWLRDGLYYGAARNPLDGARAKGATTMIIARARAHDHAAGLEPVSVAAPQQPGVARPGRLPRQRRRAPSDAHEPCVRRWVAHRPDGRGGHRLAAHLAPAHQHVASREAGEHRSLVYRRPQRRDRRAGQAAARQVPRRGRAAAERRRQPGQLCRGARAVRQGAWGWSGAF